MFLRRVVAVLGAVALVLVGSACQPPKRTYLTPLPGELTYGDNRLLNACRLVPPELADQAFGDQPAVRTVEDGYAEDSVPEGQIRGVGDVMSRCTYDLAGGGILSVTLRGWRDAESAREAYSGGVGRKVTGDEGPLDDGSALQQKGIRGNYLYWLELTEAPSGLSEDAVARGTRELAAALVQRIDQSGLSRPADVSASADIDVCAAFSAATFAAALRADPEVPPLEQRASSRSTWTAGSPSRPGGRGASSPAPTATAIAPTRACPSGRRPRSGGTPARRPSGAS